MTQIPNIIKLATKIPHELVNEKVKMYLYLEEWKQKIKNMHSQYNEKIIIINNNIHFNLKSIEKKTNYHQPIIPLLIKEKVQSYLQEIYRQRWLKNIKIMHDQYHQYITIEELTCNFYNLLWNGKAILFIGINTGYYMDKCCMTRKREIFRFIDPSSYVKFQRVPSKYHYSSGLNHPSAYYKYDPRQFKRELHWSEKKTKYWKYKNPMLQSQ